MLHRAAAGVGVLDLSWYSLSIAPRGRLLFALVFHGLFGQFSLREMNVAGECIRGMDHIHISRQSFRSVEMTFRP